MPGIVSIHSLEIAIQPTLAPVKDSGIQVHLLDIGRLSLLWRASRKLCRPSRVDVGALSRDCRRRSIHPRADALHSQSLAHDRAPPRNHLEIAHGGAGCGGADGGGRGGEGAEGRRGGALEEGAELLRLREEGLHRGEGGGDGDGQSAGLALGLLSF